MSLSEFLNIWFQDLHGIDFFFKFPMQLDSIEDLILLFSIHLLLHLICVAGPPFVALLIILNRALFSRLSYILRECFRCDQVLLFKKLLLRSEWT